MKEGDFPSLAKRPYEDNPAIPDIDTTHTTLLEALPPVLKNAVDKAVQQSDTAHESFLQRLPGVKKSVSAARGSAPASEFWVVAQVQLSALEMNRSPSVSALADLDSLYMKRLDEEFSGEEKGAAILIARSREKVEAQVSRQQREIDQLISGMR